MRLPLLLALAFTTTLLAQKPQSPVDLKWDNMDLGPFHSGTYRVGEQFTAKGIAIRVGQGEQRGTVLFDTELLRWSAAWPGGFILFPRVRGGLEGQITPDGEPAFNTGYTPGWSSTGALGEDPRDRHQGNFPGGKTKFRGLYLHGDQVVVSYTVDGTEVLELPGYQSRYGQTAFTRLIKVGPSTKMLRMLVWDTPKAPEPSSPPPLLPDIHVRGRGANITRLRTTGGHQALEIEPHSAPLTVEVFYCPTPTQRGDIATPGPELDDLFTLTKGGPARWGAPLETKGALSTNTTDAYVADEITLPEDNGFGSWFRPSAHDFLPDGTAVLASLSGDIWLVSGLDEKLEHVKWRRFATGLFQPLGLKVVDGQIYVLGRDQITRLHDLNGDGEADFYECFNNDCIVTENYHEFALDLQTDGQGNFLYAKGSPWQPTVLTPHQGCLLRVSKDGSKLDVLATGLRAPNGVGVGPKGEITVSDNQGHWMPANRLNLIRPGGFYGMLPAAHRVLTFRGPDGEFKANPSSPQDQLTHQEKFWGTAQTPRPEEGYDLPLCWLPMAIDNSSGGEVWAPAGPRWGPLAGQMLQMSYGKCTLFNVLQESVDGVPQAGVVKLPIKFPSGIMRGRFSPRDGQLYVSGLRVWQTDGAKDGCFSRVRYTGKPLALPVGLRTTATGAEITFAEPLDPELANDPDSYNLERWNYVWSGAYGSPDFSVRDPEKRGRDQLTIEKAVLSSDRKSVALTIADWCPAMQVRYRFQLHTIDGKPLEQEIHATIHRIPTSPATK